MELHDKKKKILIAAGIAAAILVLLRAYLRVSRSAGALIFWQMGNIKKRMKIF